MKTLINLYILLLLSSCISIDRENYFTMKDYYDRGFSVSSNTLKFKNKSLSIENKQKTRKSIISNGMIHTEWKIRF